MCLLSRAVKDIVFFGFLYRVFLGRNLVSRFFWGGLSVFVFGRFSNRRGGSEWWEKGKECGAEGSAWVGRSFSLCGLGGFCFFGFFGFRVL